MESEDLGDVLEGHVDDVVGVLLDRLEVRERVALVELEAGLETEIGPIYIFMIVNGKVGTSQTIENAKTPIIRSSLFRRKEKTAVTEATRKLFIKCGASFYIELTPKGHACFWQVFPEFLT